MKGTGESEKTNGQIAYEELIAYCTEQEKESLLSQLNALPYDPESNQAFAKDILAGHWTKLFSNTDCALFPSRVLNCLRLGLISSLTYATAQKFYNIMTYPSHKDQRVRVEWIFNPDNGKRNPNSCSMIGATMKLASSSFKAYLLKERGRIEIAQRGGEQLNETEELVMSANFNILEELEKANHSEWSAEQETRFYQLLKLYPMSEHCFLILPDVHFYEQSNKLQGSILQNINYRLGFNVFSRLRVGGQPMCMIPSEGMIEAFMKVTRLHYPVRSAFRFGLSPVLSMHAENKKRTRDRIVTTDLFSEKTPKMVDNHRSQKEYAEPEGHDVYHLALHSNIPVPDNNFFNAIVDEALRIANIDPRCSRYAQLYAETIIDMEHRAYDPNIGKSLFLIIFENLKEKNQDDPNWRFWVSLEYCDEKAGYNYGIRASEKNHQLEERLAKEKELLTEHLVKWLLDNESFIMSSYGFTLLSLINYNPENFSCTLANIQRNLRVFLQKQVERDLEGLYKLIVPSAKSRMEKNMSLLFRHRPVGHLLRSRVLEEIEVKLEDNFIQGLVFAADKMSPLLLEKVLKVFFKNFQRYLSDGTLDKIRDEQLRAYNYLLSHFRHTENCGQLLSEAIKAGEGGRKAFEVLYDPALVNKVYADKRTLIYHAMVAEDLDLMFRLTNDGANVGEVEGAQKPCPLSESIFLARHELTALLMLAYYNGKGWVSREPKSVQRIRRLALSKVRDDEDKEWLEKMLSLMPEHLVGFSVDQLNSITQEIEQDTVDIQQFFENMNQGKPIELNPVTEKFIKLKAWHDKGGLKPSTPN